MWKRIDDKRKDKNINAHENILLQEITERLKLTITIEIRDWRDGHHLYCISMSVNCNLRNVFTKGRLLLRNLLILFVRLCLLSKIFL